MENELKQIKNQNHLKIYMIYKKELENELDNLYENKAKGAQVR